jgi:hypothetical protein
MMDEDEDDEKSHFSLENLVQEESSKKKSVLIGKIKIMDYGL